MALQYNFIDNNYTIYTPTPEPEKPRDIYLDLFGDLGTIDGIVGQSSNGTLIAADNTSKMTVNNNPEDDGSGYINNYTTPTEEIEEQEEIDPYRPWQEYAESKYSDNELAKMSLEELIKKENIPARITSAFRPNSKTSKGRASNHSKKDQYGVSLAHDIAPTKGHSFDDLRKSLYENPNVVKWFQLRGYGVLEEMVRDNRRGFYDVRGQFHGTGATGPHFHIGPDSLGVEWYNNRIQTSIPSKVPKNEWIERLSNAYRKLGVSENGIKNLLSKNILESGWGSYTVGDFNYGNIKIGSSWNGKSKKGYRSYNSIDEYAKDELNLLTRLYDFNDSDDIKTFTDKLQGNNNGKRKYAEGANYKEKIKQIYKQL